MRIAKIESIHLDTPVPVYDVVNATPYHNFLIKTRSSKRYIISHNCGIMDEVNFAPG